MGNNGAVPGFATIISAVPAGGYLFQNWTVEKGNPVNGVWSISNDYRELTYIDDFNCAGKRIISDSLKISQIGSSFNMPHIILMNTKSTIVFGTHHLGDVNNDNKVDIRDISKISSFGKFLKAIFYGIRKVILNCPLPGKKRSI